MKKNIILLSLLLFTMGAYAQLKVGDNPSTINSNSLLELESTNKGFLPPRMTSAQRDAITNPPKGLILYNTTLSCLQINDGTPTTPNWTSLGSTAPSVIANCDDNGFVGNFIAGRPNSGTSFSVRVTNNSFSTATISFQNSDLVLSGVSGLTVTSTSPASATLNAGQSQLVTYTITGTPAAQGTLTGNWTKIALSCTRNISVTIPPPTFNCAGTVVTPNNYNLVNNTSYTGTVTVPYTVTQAGGTYPAQTITNQGITFTRTAGTYASSGTVSYTISGTYTGTTNAVFFVTLDAFAGGCRVAVWDAILAGINAGGGSSVSAYNAGTVNQLVPITQAEYNQILNTVTGAQRAGSTTVTTGAYGGANTMGGSNSSTWTNLPSNGYICAVSVGSYTNCTGHFRVTCASSTTGTSTCLTDLTTSISFGASVYYFAVKRPTTHCGSNTFLGKINTGLTSPSIGGGQSGGNGYYYNAGSSGSCGTAANQTVGWNDALQVITSTQKSW